MGGVKKAANKVSKVAKKAINNPFINPVGYAAHKGVSLLSKPLLGREITPYDGMKIGAVGGTAVAGAGALGLFGGGAAGAGGVGAGTAGLGGATTASGVGAGTAGLGGATTASALGAPTAAGVAKVAGMTGLQKLAAVAGGGLVMSGLSGRQPEVENIVAAGDEERAQKMINELAAEQEAKRTSYLDETRKTLSARRAENVAKLQGRFAEQSRLEMPHVLEDLNSRGLFNSESAVANAIAEKQAGNSLQVQGFEQQQSMADSALEDQISSDIIEGRLGMEQEGLRRRFGLEDAATQGRLAQMLAARQAKSQRNSSLIGLGGQLLGSTLFPRLAGVA